MIRDTFWNECNSWNDFQRQLISLQKKEKGDAFEFLTKLFFKINPVYSFYDEVWMLSEVPQKTLEYLGIPSHDLGIDLIAKNGNDYHAIQCKFHTEIDSSVSFKEVATFISMLEGNKKFTQGYICSSANITSRNFEKIETKPITTILADSWQNLDFDFFDKARKYLKREKYSPIAFQPKEHQVKALQKAVLYFEKEKQARGKLIFPCGAGKSLTGYWLTQELQAKSTIIAVPSLSLVKQTLDVYLREIVAKGKKVKWLCICSDEGIGSDEDIVFKTENLGVPCQTDPIYIKKWLHENSNEDIVIFTTYQSGRIIAEISKQLNFTFDVGIFDEAHKTVGANKKLFSYLLFEENIAIKKRIFMTATERFYAGSKDDIISMDDEEIYGDTFAHMSFKEAIEMELLTDYKVITIDVKKSEIADFIKDNNLVQLNDKWKKETEARSLASMLALRKAMKLFPIKNAVSFHSSIDKAVRNKELQSYITDTYHYSPIDSFTVSGKMPTTKRNVIIKEFADSPKSLITNARCLTEGVDVPNIDCIVFADPRKSKVDIVQALGRALRKKEGKDWGYVILPVVYDDITHEIDNENFNEILAIVRGLASNDDRIIEYFKDKKDAKTKKKAEKIDQFQFEVFSDFIDANQLSEQLQIRLWDKLSQFNWVDFEIAKKYLKKFNITSLSDFKIKWEENIFTIKIPKNPRGVYKNSGFTTIPDFLGYDSLIQEWKNWEESTNIIHHLKIKSSAEYRKYVKENPIKGIHSSPESYFKNIWDENGGWSGFLGKSISSQEKTKHRLAFEKAKEYVHTLEFKTGDEWKNYTKSTDFPIFLPSAPQNVYQQWIDINDWIGPTYLQRNQRKSLKYLSFELARKIVISQKFKNWNEFKNWGEKPHNIPLKPNEVYKNQFKGRRDWLGIDPYFTDAKKYLDYSTASDILKAMEITSNNHFRNVKKQNSLPPNFPLNPEKYYRDIWEQKGGWAGFLGTKNKSSKAKNYLSFIELKNHLNTIKLSSKNAYAIFFRENHFELMGKDIPSAPNVIYKAEWKGWADFLGKEEEK